MEIPAVPGRTAHRACMLSRLIRCKEKRAKALLFLAVDRTIEDRVRQVCRKGTKRVIAGFPRGPCEDGALPDPHGADRQLQPVRPARQAHRKRLRRPYLRRRPGSQRHRTPSDQALSPPEFEGSGNDPVNENGQAERRVRTLKDATVKSLHYASITDPFRSRTTFSCRGLHASNYGVNLHLRYFYKENLYL